MGISRQRAEYKRVVEYIDRKCTRKGCDSKSLLKEGQTIYCPKCFWHYSKQGPKKNKR